MNKDQIYIAYCAGYAAVCVGAHRLIDLNDVAQATAYSFGCSDAKVGNLIEESSRVNRLIATLIK